MSVFKQENLKERLREVKKNENFLKIKKIGRLSPTFMIKMPWKSTAL